MRPSVALQADVTGGLVDGNHAHLLDACVVEAAMTRTYPRSVSGAYVAPQVAKILGHPATALQVAAMCDSGAIAAEQPCGAGTAWLIPQNEVDRLLRQQDLERQR